MSDNTLSSRSDHLLREILKTFDGRGFDASIEALQPLIEEEVRPYLEGWRSAELYTGEKRGVPPLYCANCSYPEVAHRPTDKCCPVQWHPLYCFEPPLNTPSTVERGK